MWTSSLCSGEEGGMSGIQRDAVSPADGSVGYG